MSRSSRPLLYFGLLCFGLLGCGLLGACAATPPANAPRAVVFFPSWSAALDPSAQGAIGAVARMAKANPADHLWVYGYADLSGSTQANNFLSQTRAQVVTDQLVAGGVAEDRIDQVGQGGVGREQVSQESRRVVITMAPSR